MVKTLTHTQKMILSDMISREREICDDKDEFLCDEDWKAYHDNLTAITTYLDGLK